MSIVLILATDPFCKSYGLAMHNEGYKLLSLTHIKSHDWQFIQRCKAGAIQDMKRAI